MIRVLITILFAATLTGCGRNPKSSISGSSAGAHTATVCISRYVYEVYKSDAEFDHTVRLRDDNNDLIRCDVI